jgi:pimeloyl-ACP methyl ester carboxylesterase
MIEKTHYIQVKTSVGPAKIRIRIWSGGGSSEKTVICFHELGCNGGEFVFLAQYLTALGFNVICPDFIGHGRSTHFGKKEAYRWFNFLSCATEVVRCYSSSSTHLLGSSFGSSILLLYMLATQARPKSATFVDISLFRNIAVSEFYIGKVETLLGDEFEFLEQANRHFEKCRHPLDPEADHLKPLLIGSRFIRVNGKYRVDCDPYAVDGVKSESRLPFDYRREIPSLKSNSLFLYGSKSPLRMPAYFEEISATSPHVTYCDEIDGDHPPNLMSRKQITPILDFILRNQVS